MTTPLRERVLRSAAIAIAVAAVIDPAVTSRRTDTPDVAVVAADPVRDAALVNRVVRALEHSFVVTAAPLSAADGTVLVGDALPDHRDDLATPVFAVPGDPGGPPVTIESIDAPATAPLAARTSVVATLHVRGARGRTLITTLRLGAVVVDRRESRIATDDARLLLPLTFEPTQVGASVVRVSAALGAEDEARAAHADLVVDVTRRPYAVFFYDPRPSWMSTFVRRAVEGDPRFAVTSRVVTSRNISTDAGAPPASLGDLAALSRYDVVAVGAPDLLSATDVAALERLLRQRGASVVLLLDQPATGPFVRLAGAERWDDNGGGAVAAITSVTNDSLGLRGSEVAAPLRLPAGASVLARYTGAARDTSLRTAIWQVPVGAGRLVVSGALDAWRYRDPSLSPFDAYWRTLLAGAAAAAPPPIQLQLRDAVTAPGNVVDVRVELRTAMLGALPVTATARGTIVAADGTIVDRLLLLPSGTAGELSASPQAPRQPGSYRVVVASDGQVASAPLVVSTDAAHPHPDDRDLVAAWVAAHGGGSVAVDQLDRLRTALLAAIHPAAHQVRWHPMRSLWWLVPFVLALSGEWWSRRRRGAP